MGQLEVKIDHLERSLKDHTKLVVQSLKEQEATAQVQTKLIERSVQEMHSQKDVICRYCERDTQGGSGKGVCPVQESGYMTQVHGTKLS